MTEDEYLLWVEENFKDPLGSFVAVCLFEKFGKTNYELNLMDFIVLYGDYVDKYVFKLDQLKLLPNIFADDSEVRKANYQKFINQPFPKQLRKQLVKAFKLVHKLVQEKGLIKVIHSRSWSKHVVNFRSPNKLTAKLINK